MSLLNGYSSLSSCVVATTCGSIGNGALATLMFRGPCVPWMLMLIWSLVL